MRILLDTHAFLWFITNDPQLSAAARAAIVEPSTGVLISPASYWEIAIKVSCGKYPLTIPFEAFVTRGIHDNGFAILPIELRHVAALTALPFHHRDPFDRLLVAQSIVEQIPIVSCDAALEAYPITRIW